MARKRKQQVDEEDHTAHVDPETHLEQAIEAAVISLNEGKVGNSASRGITADQVRAVHAGWLKGERHEQGLEVLMERHFDEHQAIFGTPIK